MNETIAMSMAGNGLAALAISGNILKALRQKNVLTKEEAREIIDCSLLQLESASASMPETAAFLQASRTMLEQLLEQITQPSPGKPK